MSNRNGSKLSIFTSKKHMQVGAQFQVLPEKEIHSAGNDAASKQWRRKRRVVNVHGVQVLCSGVVENKFRRGAEHTQYVINVGLLWRCSEEKLSHAGGATDGSNFVITLDFWCVDNRCNAKNAAPVKGPVPAGAAFLPMQIVSVPQEHSWLRKPF
jgi:hypothetical protein